MNHYSWNDLLQTVYWGKNEESFMISKFKNILMFKIGANRGGNDLINEISLVNKLNRNSGRYFIPIGVVERSNGSSL